MTTAAPTTSAGPAAGQAALPVAYVESDTTPGTYYRTTPQGCSCKAYQFGSARDASYRCKHMQGQGFYGSARCRMCREWSVFEQGDYCAGCMAMVLAEAERVKAATLAALTGATPLRPMSAERAAMVVEMVRGEAARTERIAGYRAEAQAMRRAGVDPLAEVFA